MPSFLEFLSFAFPTYRVLYPIWKSDDIKLEVGATMFAHFRKGRQLFLEKCLLVS